MKRALSDNESNLTRVSEKPKPKKEGSFDSPVDSPNPTDPEIHETEENKVINSNVV